MPSEWDREDVQMNVLRNNSTHVAWHTWLDQHPVPKRNQIMLENY